MKQILSVKLKRRSKEKDLTHQISLMNGLVFPKKKQDPTLFENPKGFLKNEPRRRR